MDDKRLRWVMSRRPGAVEAVLSRSFGGARTPLDWLARAVSSTSKRVLVVTCGSGVMVEKLSDGERFVVGLDWSASALAEAARQGRGELVQADTNYLPFRSEMFDAIVSEFGLAVNENRALMLSEAARVLRPGGLFAGLAPSLRPLGLDDVRSVGRMARQLRGLPHLPGDTEFSSGALLAHTGLTRAEDARAKFYFDVRNRDDAELLVRGLRATDDAQRARHVVNYLAARARQHAVRIPLPMRRILALK